MNRNIQRVLPFLSILLVGHSAISQTTRPSAILGVLISVNENELIVQTIARAGQSEQAIIPWDQHDRIVIDGSIGMADRLRPGMRITAIRSPGTRFRPEHTQITAISDGLPGTVVRVEGTTLVLETVSSNGGSTDVRISTDDTTKVIFYDEARPGRYDARIGKISDLMAQTKVNVIPKSGTATHIMIQPFPTTQPRE